MRPFTALVVCLFVTSSTWSAEPATPGRSKSPLGSTVFKWEDLVATPTAKGARRNVANQPSATLSVFECHITTLNPGMESHPPHRHPQEELILVKDGTLEVHINGRTRVAGAGSVFFYASNDAHAVKNVGQTSATYWVINVATPTTRTPSAHNPKPSLPSGVFDWAKIAPQPTKTGERRGILKGSTVTMESLSCHATTVEVKEASHAAHRHPDDEIVIIKEGDVEINIEGKTQLATAGSVCFFSSNDLHGMRNAGNSRATYYVIRAVTTATPKAAK